MTMLKRCGEEFVRVVPGLTKPELHCRFPDKADFGEMLVDLERAGSHGFA